MYGNISSEIYISSISEKPREQTEYSLIQMIFRNSLIAANIRTGQTACNDDVPAIEKMRVNDLCWERLLSRNLTIITCQADKRVR